MTSPRCRVRLFERGGCVAVGIAAWSPRSGRLLKEAVAASWSASRPDGDGGGGDDDDGDDGAGRCLLSVADSTQQPAYLRQQPASGDCSNQIQIRLVGLCVEVTVALLPLLVLSGPAVPVQPPPGPSAFRASVAVRRCPLGCCRSGRFSRFALVSPFDGLLWAKFFAPSSCLAARSVLPSPATSLLCCFPPRCHPSSRRCNCISRRKFKKGDWRAS